MKAVVYSGELRSWSDCKENQASKIGEADLYFYTYEAPGIFNCRAWQKAEPWDGVWNPCYDSNKHPWIDTARTIKQWENAYMAFQLVPDRYDVIIRSRTDIVIDGKINWALYPIRKNTIYVPIGNDFEDGINDQFAFGDYETMKKYFEVYKNHPALFAQGLRFHTEFYVLKNLEYQGVNVIRPPEFTNRILR